MTPDDFRRQFPALATWTWLDTPGSPPGAQPVIDTLAAVLADWSTGEFDWLTWDQVPQQARRLLAGYVGVDIEQIALVGSVAEAASAVAGGLKSGRIVVPNDEFRSNLLPWLQLDPQQYEVVRVPSRDGATRTEDLIAACDDRTSLLAVSEVLSSNGIRTDLAALRIATEQVGARLFVDATQSMGALHLDLGALRPDFVAVHGYKWMLCPRGAAWVVTRSDRVAELTPVAPSWRSGSPPHAYFGGSLPHDAAAARCDSSPAWLSWLGAVAALRLLSNVDPRKSERHVIKLADAFRDGAKRLGLHPVATGTASQIAAVRVPEPEAVKSALRRHGVKATSLPDRVRVGFHYFNDETDVETALAALENAL